MGSRKESLKKSLGISEYPWSSDEEDSSALQPVQVVRRQSDEPRPSVADMPGTSAASDDTWWREQSASQPEHATGSQQAPSSPATVRKQQAKMDRALFWSIINNTPRPSNTPVTRPRLCEVPLTMLSPPSGPPRSEARESRRSDRPSTSATDIRRILAFKKLTRSLHNLTYKGPSNTHPATRRLAVSVGSSRSPLFTPSLPSDAASSPRSRATSSRSQLPRSSIRYPHRNYAYHMGILPEEAVSGRCRAPRPGVRSDIDTSPPAPEPHHYVNVDQSDDDVEAVSETPATAEQNDDNNADEEHAETPTHDASAGAISLEEEIVEVDAPDEPDTAPTVDVESDAPEPHISNENNAAATTSDENAESAQPQSPFHGIKRKRETNEENAEPYSVQEFNQSLLRLLECPVCLEWMEPPISQCRRGHLVCSRCRMRLASCPVCRTTFSSVRNRAMEGVAEMLRYPCRHGCGREVRLRRRAPHEASCGARRYHCPAPPCARHPPLPHHDLAHHFQCKHLPILKIGRKHKFSMKVNSEQHDTWLIMALDEFFHLRVDVDIRTWGVIVYVAYIGPKRKAKHYTYEVTVEGHHNSRSLKYARATHSDLESPSLNVSRQDCFHLTLDQALNFLRFKNRHCEPDKFLDFDVEIGKCQSANSQESKDDSDS
nr:uncharacterized protein LOC110384163 isoform X1 [Helicoverpa armigera]XP_049703269.1 uncharacterized protein LOC110384163 isoform X2 [Helicoverpa armigera]XP_049703270.1 uncharacterized protein LOC110384163 isoform X3 [Helicoverpa armigera]